MTADRRPQELENLLRRKRCLFGLLVIRTFLKYPLTSLPSIERG